MIRQTVIDICGKTCNVFYAVDDDNIITKLYHLDASASKIDLSDLLHLNNVYTALLDHHENILAEDNAC